MSRYPQYEAWATAILERQADISDWEGMAINEAARRAVAICKVADEMDKEFGHSVGSNITYCHLKKMAEYLEKRYPNNR
jgi:hypothetical protein